jgi:HEAT repeat protein
VPFVRSGVATGADAGASHAVNLSAVEIGRSLDATRDPAQQKALIDRLYTGGMSSGPAAPSRARALRMPSKEVRLAALAALYNMGAAAGAASVAPLVAALADPDAEIRAGAARALGTLGSWIWQEVPEHVAASLAAQVAQQPLAALTADPQQPLEVRLQAASALAQMPVTAGIAPALVAGLAFGDDDVRVQICRALVRARAPQAVPPLEARLRDATARVQVAIAEALLAAGASKHAVQRLRRLLVEPGVDMTVRAKAAYVLQDHPADARPALRELLQAAFMSQEALIESMPSDGREEVRQWAVKAVDRIGAPAVPFILPYVRAEPRGASAAEQRRRAIDRLCALGPAARAAVPTLMPLLASRDGQTRGDVARCLVGNIRVAPAQIAPKVLPLLSDRDRWVVSEVVRATNALGPSAAPALPRLRKLARDGEASVRAAALDTIGAIGVGGASARPELDGALADPDTTVHTAAALALVKTRADPARGLQRLLDLLAGPNPRRDAAWRLGELASQPERKQVLSALVAALGTTNPGHHEAVAHAIAAFGEEAAPVALVPLTKALERDWYGLSKEACGALASFGPKILPAVPALVQTLASGNGFGSASQALLTTARRAPEVAAAVKARCQNTTGRQRSNCLTLIKQIDAREEPAPAP